MIVLDTHALLWLASDPDRLGARARATVEQDPERAISAISAQEIAYLVMRGRIELDRPTGRWIRDAMAVHDVHVLAANLPIAVRAGSLDDGFPGDPADRLIYSTAVHHDARLVSADERLRRVDPERVVW